MQGTYAHREASLRVAVPDYIKKGKTGARTYAPEMFPRQTYEIDGIDGLWKTDLISQTNLNQKECSVVMTRGSILANLSGWRADGGDLPSDTYREWDVDVSFDGQTYNMAFAFPDANAQRLCSWETLIFFSEFLHSSGLFRVFYWDFGIKREGAGTWEPIYAWRVSHHDGSLDAFGVRRAWHAGVPVIEVGNDPGSTYLPVDTVIDITPSEINITACGCDSGGNHVLQWSANKTDLVFWVESCSSLGAPGWTPVVPTSQWPVSTLLWTNSVPPTNRSVFYRVKTME
jgi:hypothetical protein